MKNINDLKKSHFLALLITVIFISAVDATAVTFPTKDSVTVLVGTLDPLSMKTYEGKGTVVRYWDIENPKIYPSRLIQVKIKVRKDVWIDPGSEMQRSIVEIGNRALRIIEGPGKEPLTGYEYLILIYE